MIVFIVGLFNDAFTSSDYITSNDRVNNELESMWCKGVMVYFEVIASRNCGKQRKSSVGTVGLQSKFEVGNCRIRSRNAT
jgi:hypothetical protein